MPKAKESVSTLWNLYAAASSAAQAARETYEKLDADAKLLRDKLVSLIPANGEREGIFHKRYEKKNVSYSNALQSVRDRLVPKTKQREVDVIIAENTTISVIDKIEALKTS